MFPATRASAWRSAAVAAAVAIATGLAIGPGPAHAVFSNESSPRERSSDSDYADGVEAFEREDWPAMLESMRKVVDRRPHHDNAWAHIGFALRRMGRYDEALEAYDRSLSLNPHNRRAMEYLGEAYLGLDRYEEAKVMLDRLAEECRRVRVSFSNDGFTDGCDEFVQLRRAIDKYEVMKGLRPRD